MAEKVREGTAGKLKIFIAFLLGILIVAIFQFYLLPVLEKSFPVLVGYDRYLRDALGAIVIFALSYVILRVIRKMIERATNRSQGRNYHGLYTIMRALVYGGAIASFLGYIGVSLTGALIGGTVGGLILSFALQNTVSNLLTGLLLASAGLVKPKDKLAIYSWMFNNPVLGEVVDIKLLTVQVMTVDGNVTELPSTALLGQTQFTNLGSGAVIRASLQIALPVDSQIRGIIEIASAAMELRKGALGVTSIELYFFGKAFNSNTIKSIFTFTRLMEYNRIVDMINTAFDEAYWEMKFRTPQGSNILLGFPVDVPVLNIISKGDAILNTRITEAGISSFHSYFYNKNSTLNTINVKFNTISGASYDVVTHVVNSSYEEAYLKLKNDTGVKD
ncbi:MAG: mechanosensitive ion channel [Thermoplasmataceae archaeon]